jgi:hypoxanthine phosphoribosyltransferase
MKFLSLTKALLDTKADATRKRLPREKMQSYCNQLAEKVRAVYSPDLIVAIAAGGTVPGELISRNLGIPIAHITIRRNIQIHRMYHKDPWLQRSLWSLYHHYLFQTTKPEVFTEITADLSGKRILLVDDTIHTGATLDVAKAYFNKKAVLDIQIATLAYVSDKVPDFSVLPKGNYCFPWSKDY